MNQLDLTFAALADPTRRAILVRLARGDAMVGELARPFAMSLPAISRHLGVLERASLIARRRVGKHRSVALNATALAEANDWLEYYRRFWTNSLERLDEHIKITKGENV